jgi:hypothetical protein
MSNEYDQLVKMVFSNEQGTKLLNHWAQMYVTRISYQPGATSEETAFREGERNVVQGVLDILEHARKEDE